MAGETNLARLLAGMRPLLASETYVFVTIGGDARPAEGLDPLMTFREPEGVTLIVDEEKARLAGVSGMFPCRLITLEIHSSLDAVGFLAAVATRLAQRGIAVNPVAAYHHDHLFVPAARAEETVEVLKALAAESASAITKT